jgi:hypothetical protein
MYNNQQNASFHHYSHKPLVSPLQPPPLFLQRRASHSDLPRRVSPPVSPPARPPRPFLLNVPQVRNRGSSLPDHLGPGDLYRLRQVRS